MARITEADVYFTLNDQAGKTPREILTEITEGKGTKKLRIMTPFRYLFLFGPLYAHLDRLEQQGYDEHRERMFSDEREYYLTQSGLEYRHRHKKPIGAGLESQLEGT